jgi:hypothetical protein
MVVAPKQPEPDSQEEGSEDPDAESEWHGEGEREILCVCERRTERIGTREPQTHTPDIMQTRTPRRTRQRMSVTLSRQQELLPCCRHAHTLPSKHTPTHAHALTHAAHSCTLSRMQRITTLRPRRRKDDEEVKRLSMKIAMELATVRTA